MTTDVATFKVDELVWSARDVFTAVRCDESINFDREAEFAIQTLCNNDYALGIARGNRQSVIDAVTNIAAIGISLNPAKKQAYLVPRDGKICLDISYMGLIDLATATGSIRWAQAALVREKDTFEIVGIDQQPRHAFSPFATDRGPVVGAYAVAKTSDGDYLTATMTVAELTGIRDRSSAWKNGKAGKKGPWESDEGEMMKKTVIKRAYKYWPKSDRLEKAIHYLNTETGEGIDFDTRKGPGTISGPRELFNELPPEVQDDLRRKAPSVDAAMPDIGKVRNIFDMIMDGWPDVDQSNLKAGLWYLLDSKTRSAIKKAAAPMMA